MRVLRALRANYDHLAADPFSRLKTGLRPLKRGSEAPRRSRAKVCAEVQPALSERGVPVTRPGHASPSELCGSLRPLDGGAAPFPQIGRPLPATSNCPAHKTEAVADAVLSNPNRAMVQRRKASRLRIVPLCVAETTAVCRGAVIIAGLPPQPVANSV